MRPQSGPLGLDVKLHGLQCVKLLFYMSEFSVPCAYYAFAHHSFAKEITDKVDISRLRADKSERISFLSGEDTSDVWPYFSRVIVDGVHVSAGDST